MATEVELKLYCSPDDIARVGIHPLIAAGVETGPAKRLENTYYDSPDLALHQERIALRVRTTPTERLQTVKCAAKSVAGLSARPEWETPYTGAFDFSAVDARKVRAFLEERQSSLVPVFTTSFERRTWRVDVSKKITLWVMVDTGHVSSGDRMLPISEVELELAQGNPEDLLDFATALATHLPLVPHDVSKAERGYQLFLKQASSPQKASPSPLGPRQTSAEAFHLLASQGMQIWQANLLGTLTSEDPEFVHQFRVSLRRLNSLLKVFKPALPDRYQAKWSKRVKELSQVTGDVRDLDVMRSGILEPMLQSDTPQTVSHAEAALAALDNTKQEAAAQVQQLRYGGPVLLFARDLQDLDVDDFPKNLSRFAEKQIAGLHRNAVKRLARTLTKEKTSYRIRLRQKPGTLIVEPNSYSSSTKKNAPPPIVPTPVLQLELSDYIFGYGAKTYQDTPTKPLEKQLNTAFLWMATYPIRKAIEAAAREEESRKRQNAYELKVRPFRIRDAELKRLEECEKDAVQFARAEKLRAYADAMEKQIRISNLGKPVSSQALEPVTWIRARANWLDPLIWERWPEVDDLEGIREPSFWEC